MNKVFTFLAALAYGKVLLIGLGVGGFYYMTMYDDGSGIESQIQSVDQLLATEEEKKKDTDNTLQQVKEMQEKVGQLSVKFQEISRKLPASLFSIDINRSIDGFAKTSGVSVKSKKPSSNIKREVVEEVPVDVVIEGSYSELAQFTYFVSMAERMTRVKNIIISESTDKNPKKLKFEGQVVGYKLASEPVPGEKEK